MEWTGIIMAALSGAVAAAVAQLVVGYKKERKGLYVVLFVFLFFGFRFAAKVYVEPGFRLWETERELKHIRLFKELSVHEPAVFLIKSQGL